MRTLIALMLFSISVSSQAVDLKVPTDPASEKYYCPTGAFLHKLDAAQQANLDLWQKAVESSRTAAEQESRVSATITHRPISKVAKIKKKGHVTVTVVVDEIGDIRFLAVYCSSDKQLDRIVLDMVSQWKFSPETVGGKPVPSIGRIPVSLNYD